MSEEERERENRKFIGISRRASSLSKWGKGLTPEERRCARIRGYFCMMVDLVLIGTIVGITNNREF